MKSSRPAALALLLLSCVLPAPSLAAASLDEEVLASLQVVAVAGREEPMAELIRGRLGSLPVERDGFGNVILTVGTGEPRRLVACALGEPGLIVSGIREDGLLRAVAAGSAPVGTLWLQSFEGQTVVLGGAKGWKAGAVVLPSTHLREAGLDREGPFIEENLYIDVGAESAAEVAEMGLRQLDPVALIRRPSRLAGGLVAAPAAASKAACVALAEVARRYRPAPGSGSVVFAWTVSTGLNPASLQHLIRRRQPIQEAILLGDGLGGFGWEDVENAPPVPKPLPAPGSGPIGAGTLPAALQVPAVPYSDRGGIRAGLGSIIPRVGWLGLPARHPGTPVETIAFRDVRTLADTLLASLGGTPAAASPGPALPDPPALAETAAGHEEAARLLGNLIGRYGVSGAEGPVREEVLKNLPGWAKPETDEKGNVTVTVGSGGEPVLFVAHLDEVGFRVEEVLPDGRLRLQTRGGLLRSAWEAQAALVHGDRGAVAGVFEPREDWRSSKKAVPPGPLTVYLGANSAREVADLGIQVGSTVTMPKRMLRIGRHRVLARSFDDRVGSTALLLAMKRIDPAKLRRRVTFAWSVEEEVGLNGARALAERLRDLAEVHPVDTFVSSDSPIESPRYAHALLGKGPVLRAMDNRFLAPRPLIERFLALGERRGIPLQVGFTGGATDGMPFLADSPVMLTFSWPGRYSHSPIEVADLRDLEALVELIVATATE